MEMLDRLSAWLDEGATEQVAEHLSSLRPVDAADIICELPSRLRADALLATTPEQAADILEELPDDLAAAAVMNMEPGRAATIVEHMVSDEVADLLQDVAPSQAEAILARIDPADAAEARNLLKYHEGSAGGLMQTELIAISEGMTAGDAVRELRERAADYSEFPASYLYVIDQDRRLRGVASLRSLLLCEATTPVLEVASSDVEFARADLPGVDVVKMFRRLHYLAIPVVDNLNRLLGIVTQDDALRFAEEEADEEMLRFAGIAGGDEFRDMPLRQRSWRRLSWLGINVLLNVLAASVIAFYQETLREVIALAVFLPIISDMSGCSGNQAVAVSIRELSLGRVTLRRFPWVLGRELSVGLLNGLALGLLIGLIAWTWKGNATLGLIVGAALWINTLVAVSIGGLLPLLLRRFGKDPAIASSPILTTVTDMTGFFLVLAAASQLEHLLT